MISKERLAALREQANDYVRLRKIPARYRTQKQREELDAARYALDFISEYDYAFEIGKLKGEIQHWRTVLNLPNTPFPEIGPETKEQLTQLLAELRTRYEEHLSSRLRSTTR